jgi:chemotaxis protein histidine kinase CheA
MTTADEEYSLEFERLSAAFVDQLPQQIQTLSDDLNAWLSAAPDAARFARLSHKVHQLKGAGGLFGCKGISDEARILEQHLDALPADVTSADETTLNEVELAMDAIRNEIDRIRRERVQSGRPGAQR